MGRSHVLISSAQQLRAGDAGLRLTVLSWIRCPARLTQSVRQMHKPPFTRIGVAVTLVIICAVLISLGWRARKRRLLTGAPAGVSVVLLGPATNYLRFDHSQTWQAFRLTNGSSHTLFYTVTAVDLQNSGGWVSNSSSAAGLMTRRETPGEIAPGGSDFFYASIPGSSTPWRLRVGCFEQGWSDPLNRSLSRFLAKARGSPVPSKSWTGRNYEFIASEVKP